MINHKHQQIFSSSQTGFTIIESLVAILVAGILLAAIAPVIVLSVGTRLQARRVELATDTAKTYLDGIKAGTIPAPPSTGTDTTKNTLDKYPAPKANTLTCDPNSYCSQPSSDLFCMSSCSTSKDFVIQAFRYNSTSDDLTNGYGLGIRVYRVDAFKDNDSAVLKSGTKQATFTGGAGDRKLPLVEITTEVSNSSTTLDSLCKRLNNTSNADPHC